MGLKEEVDKAWKALRFPMRRMQALATSQNRDARDRKPLRAEEIFSYCRKKGIMDLRLSARKSGFYTLTQRLPTVNPVYVLGERIVKTWDLARPDRARGKMESLVSEAKMEEVISRIHGYDVSLEIEHGYIDAVISQAIESMPGREAYEGYF